MAKNGKMQQVVRRVLSVMLVASFLLAILSLVWLTPVMAYDYCQCVFKTGYDTCEGPDQKCHYDIYEIYCAETGWTGILCRIDKWCWTDYSCPP